MYASKSFGSCEHNEAFGSRQEYCLKETDDLDFYARMALEALDKVIYTANRTDVFSMSVDNREQHAERELSYLSGNFATWVWPLMNTVLKVSHTINKPFATESYLVEDGWSVMQSGVTGECITKYYLEVAPGQVVDGCVEELDVIGNSRSTRPMSEYDYGQLIEKLSAAEGYLKADERDEVLSTGVEI